MKDIILTTYFTTKPDPQRGTTWAPDDPDLMSGWIDTVTDLDLTGVVFHDEPVGSRKNGKVSFVPWPLRTAWSCNDERFLCWLDFLEGAGKTDVTIDHVFLTDLFDVDFFRDPFDLITARHDLYLGCGAGYPRPIGENRWLCAKMTAAYGRVYHPDKCTVNAGVIGGRYADVVRLLRHMVNDFIRLKSDQNINMAVFNRAVYDLFDEDRIMIGPPVCSLFKKYQQTGDFCIRHK